MIQESNEDTHRSTGMTPQDLNEIYSKQKAKLVYQKYADKGDWEMKAPVYASYLINVANLSKNHNPKIQYQQNAENDEMLKEELSFNSLFESGNLYAAFKVEDNGAKSSNLVGCRKRI